MITAPPLPMTSLSGSASGRKRGGRDVLGHGDHERTGLDRDRAHVGDPDV
jgi:hypothetical protein